jgi:hypothetical protein
MVLSSAAAWALDAKEGDWEIAMTTTMQGMPFQMPPQSYKMTQCVTKDDMAPVDKSKKDCVIKEQKIVGNTFYWKVTCEDASGRMDGDGKILYAGTTYNGTINMKMTDKRNPGTMTMLTKLNGRYLGPCSAKTKAEAEQRRASYKK